MHIVFLAPHSSCNADHETKSDWEAALHVGSNITSIGFAYTASWEASDNYVVIFDAAEGILIIIATHRCGTRVLVTIQGCHNGRFFDGQRTDHSDLIVLMLKCLRRCHLV